MEEVATLRQLIILISTADDSMENSQFFKNRQNSLIRHSSFDIRHSKVISHLLWRSDFINYSLLRGPHELTG